MKLAERVRVRVIGKAEDVRVEAEGLVQLERAAKPAFAGPSRGEVQQDLVTSLQHSSVRTAKET